MAVAFDAYSVFAGVDPGGTHTPVGTPAAILGLTTRGVSESIATFTYGGVSMGSPVASFTNTVGGEMANSVLDAYLLTSSIPTGAQTVAVDGGAGGNVVQIYSLTASDVPQFINSVTLESVSVTNPSTTLTLSGRTCFVAMIFFSGQNDVAGVTPLANWTSRSETDAGVVVVGGYSYDIVSSTDVTVGYTAGADDALLLAVAISETVALPALSWEPKYRHVGPPRTLVVPSGFTPPMKVN